MSEEMVIYFELLYSIDKGRIKKFITLNYEEVKIKTSEVICADSDTVHLEFRKISATKSFFLAELRKAALCL